LGSIDELKDIRIDFLVEVFLFVTWGILRWKAPNYTPMLVYILLLGYPLGWYNAIDGQHEKQDSRCMEISYYMLLCFVQGINNNSFLTNLVVKTPVVLIPAYLLLKKCGDLEGLSETGFQIRYLNLVLILLILHGAHYLRQKELCIVVI
jgi:hypothetical protein